ncbi:MAG: dTDP-4-dehydrorhamnose reductase [Kiritimatiellae bacterium]|nr:dTDP-4-dehydrorhamnose reductase [Kiritimatiellia bacterium]
MKVIILGARGMLGRDLVAACASRAMEAIGLDLPELDITSPDEVEAKLPAGDWVVNCAAYTKVDEAERARDAARAVNAAGAGHVARVCQANGMRLLHVSTDYVFDGAQTTPYREDDGPNPLNWYGRTKLDGERAVERACERAIIVRAQSLFGPHGHCFVRTIARLLCDGRAPLRVVDDQVSAPTYTGHLADAMLRLLNAGASGRVHVSAAGRCSWFEFALAVAAQMQASATVEPITAAQYAAEHPQAARRPKHAVLDTTRYTRWTGHTLPSWEQGLADYFKAAGA